MYSILENMKWSRADAFYQPKPGTDLVWLGATTKYIIDNDLHDKAFLNDWVDNYEDYYKSLELFTMDFAEETTGIPKEQIISFAEEQKFNVNLLGNGCYTTRYW